MKYVSMQGESESRQAMRKVAASELPAYWNNADTKYFPPVFNQSGGSCGSASRIGYMFTHEINALRDLSASDPDNQYPTHFVWLFTNGNDGKDQFVEFVGVPNVTTYGGRTYSDLFGYQVETNEYFGWMTGYDKWMNAVSNRMLRPTSNPLTVNTKEGRLAAKAWLYNHAGDTDFKAGGLIGLGVASAGTWRDIPKTDANVAAGVAGKKYVYRWGTQVDHAVTMVGWDDRIEFDLDGNGIAGEEDKDEKGAWIIVNSWGLWCNEGFIYCPYKYAGPVSDQETGEMKAGYWSGELYHARKNFRPLRVIKLKMDYTHRSELLLQAGISTDLNATEPDGVTDMHHFRYGGDGNYGNTDPAPAMPMLGKWGTVLHHEPMEFCYDLTDLSAGFDTNKPLKYFFIINRKKDTNAGTGNVYDASIVDLERDLEGIESPFDLGGEKFEITTDGKRLILSAIVYGNGYEPVNNLMYADGTLSWSAPTKSSHEVASYNVYKDGVLLGNTNAMTYSAEGGQEYSVAAVYADGTASAKASCRAAVVQNKQSVAFDNTGFTIPNIFGSHYNECTIEFYIYPTKFANYNNTAGPGWGTYMHHFNSDGTFTVGWNTSGGNRMNGSQKFALNTWQHVSIVVKGNKMTLYKNGTSIGSFTSSTYSGLGGFGDLVFSSSSGSNSWQNAKYDEIRIWDHARTDSQIKGGTFLYRRQEFYGDVLPKGLLAYYKGDTFLGDDGKYYLRDCVGSNHAPISASADPADASSSPSLVNTSLKAVIEVDAPGEVYAGVPVALTATRSEAINKVWWTIPSCGIDAKALLSPTVTFAEPGTHTVTVYGSDYSGKEYSSEMQIEVKAAPALDASFTMSAETLPCSEHLSLRVNNFADACSYEWYMPGAEVETCYGAKAGATYSDGGDYQVKLKITSADGRIAESTQTVHVTNVAPVADFELSETVVLKGTPVMLNSKARYGATDFEWLLNGDAQRVTITEGRKNQPWTPKYSGKYDVWMKASNFMGSSSITKEKALVVTNDDSRNGLFFSQNGAKLTVPMSVNLLAFTMEFWANPTSLSASCWGIGDSENTLLITVNSSGTMTVTVNGTTANSGKGFVEAGTWNHYAIRRTVTGALYFYRNGVRYAYVGTGMNRNAIKGMDAIVLGVEGAPMNGGIDEFRIWNSDYSSIQNTCNQHMDNPEDYVASNKLLVYYDFNQTSGDVVDRTGNGNTGVRSGFGPDGDAWALSKGVFSLYFGNKQNDETLTGIDELGQDEPVAAGRVGVYTLSGQYLGTTVEGLPAGVYIVDGKKVALK